MISGNTGKGYLLVVLAATLWATLGIFYTVLTLNYHFSRVSIVFWRALIAAGLLFIVLVAFRRPHLQISRRDWRVFLALGCFGIAFFYIVYIYAISLSGMGVAAVLLYTAPIWVTIYGIIALNERLDAQKAITLLLATGGIILVGQIYNIQALWMSLPGLLAGLGAGIGYATFIILNKLATQRQYSPWAINAYSFGIGAILLGLMQTPAEQKLILTTSDAWLWLIALGTIPTLGGGIAFISGLRFLPASNASIVATLEPVIASILGWVLFNEKIDIVQLIGGGLIIFAVVILHIPTKNSI